MKGDFTRDSFQPAKHYQQVLMQQGRVQLDADWNEQAAITARRDETTTWDLVGACGGPADTAAFAIITDPAVLNALPADPAAPVRQFALSAGRYYVQGRQCEAEAPFLFSWQPDHRPPAPLNEGDHLVYLDVWQRHLTMHEAPELREPALGGPDTGTRVKTVWQVRTAPLDTPLDPDAPLTGACQQPASEFEQRQRPVLPRLAARTAVPTPNTDPCTVPASAGFRGLENQLYRVEIHLGGGLDEATYKWSRENGTVITRISDSLIVTVDGVEVTRLTVDSVGPDENLGFSTGDIVEIIHDSDELQGIPGALAKIGSVDDATGRITLSPLDNAPLPATIDQTSNPRLRRWEGTGLVAVDAAVNDGFVALEQGVEIHFELPPEAAFRSGDYWQIAARTATPDAQSGRIQWPASGEDADFLPPQGILHRDCRLAIVSIDAAGQATQRSDCRCLWPPLTAVPRLFYVSGDGQEVLPDLAQAAGTLVKLPRPLIVGLANGHCHAKTTRVRFEVVNTAPSPSGGQVVAAGEAPTETVAVVPLDAAGLASADFYLDATQATQQVVARLLDSADNAVSLPLVFNASLSIASRVAYQPGESSVLAEQVTVQAAIDALASLHNENDGAQPGMQIKGVFVAPGPLALGMRLTLGELREGLRVDCDRDVDPKTVIDGAQQRGEPTCFATAEVPVPLTRDQIELWGREGVAGYTPVVLTADVDVNGNQIVWKPSQFALRGLTNVFNQMGQFNLGDRILVRLTLKGSFIWAIEGGRDNQPLYLDGDSFRMAPGENEFGIRLPSGDGRRGGDFQTWFWLFPG